MTKDTWEKHLEKNIAEIIEQVQTKQNGKC